MSPLHLVHFRTDLEITSSFGSMSNIIFSSLPLSLLVVTAVLHSLTAVDATSRSSSAACMWTNPANNKYYDISPLQNPTRDYHATGPVCFITSVSASFVVLFAYSLSFVL
jgi:hypothetical protein